MRFLASLGAGGVIYLSPLVFNQLGLSATQIGIGLALAAFVGTLARLITGRLLDSGRDISSAIKIAALAGISGDFWLFNSYTHSSYIFGQVLLGIAAGIYWPSVELAVPKSCGEFPSNKGFALVRSADALGTSLGALLGAIAAQLEAIRNIYLVEIFCLAMLLIMLNKRSNIEKNKRTNNSRGISLIPTSIEWGRSKWLKRMLPILVLSFIATGIFSLIQSALPLDLVIGGIRRPPLSEGWSGGLISIQLFLLVIFQWPIGRWLADLNPRFGITLSIANFGIGCLLLAISGLWEKGILLVLLAQVPIAIGLAAFLPTATEVVIQIPPIGQRGLAIALFSQCFAVSALISPIIAGRVIDSQGNGILIWLGMGVSCIALLPITRFINSKN